MAKQFDLDGPSALSVTFYAGFNGKQMVEITARQTCLPIALQLRISLDELLAFLDSKQIREEANNRKML
jgi:hypothetical protein